MDLASATPSWHTMAVSQEGQEGWARRVWSYKTLTLWEWQRRAPSVIFILEPDILLSGVDLLKEKKKQPKSKAWWFICFQWAHSVVSSAMMPTVREIQIKMKMKVHQSIYVHLTSTRQQLFAPSDVLTERISHGDVYENTSSPPLPNWPLSGICTIFYDSKC